MIYTTSQPALNIRELEYYCASSPPVAIGVPLLVHGTLPGSSTSIGSK